MTEETALELLAELQLVNDNLTVLADAVSPVIYAVAFIAGLFSMFFGAYLISLLLSHMKGR